MFRHLLVPWLVSLPGQVVQLLGTGLLGDCSRLLDIMVAAAPIGIMDFGEALQDNALGLIGEQCQASYAECFLCALACTIHVTSSLCFSTNLLYK